MSLPRAAAPPLTEVRLDQHELVETGLLGGIQGPVNRIGVVRRQGCGVLLGEVPAGEGVGAVDDATLEGQPSAGLDALGSRSLLCR